MYLFRPPTSIIYSSPGPRCCCVVWASATNAVAWLWHRTDYCAFLHERREPQGVPSPCGHSCRVCAIVCLTVMPSFSDTTDVSTTGHSFKTDRSRTPLFHVAQVRRRHYRPRIKFQKTARSVARVEPTTFRTAATDDDKDWRLSERPCLPYIILAAFCNCK